MTIIKNLYRRVIQIAGIIVFLILPATILQAATQIDITGPAGSGSFGANVAVLPNGNIVVTDPTFDLTAPLTLTDVGAVYLYDGRSGSLISRVTGSCRNDNLGSGGIKILNNGNFLISSPSWDAPAANGTQVNTCLGGSQLVLNDAGAVTPGKPATGISGTVNSQNSLTGSNSNDRISGSSIVVLPNGNYIVQSILWNENRGAVTFSSGDNPVTGQVSASNSLIGSDFNDLVGRITVLANSNYVVSSSSWNQNRGSATLCSGVSGCAGLVSFSNSLVGLPGDSVSIDGVTALTNGNYLVRSRLWNGQRGAVTFGNGVTGIIGEVSASNSLVGSTVNDFVGSGDGFTNSGLTVLTNGNYVIISANWHNGANVNVGAATFGNGATGVSGVISSSNSLIGSSGSDFYITRTTALTNGNYVLFLPRWSAPVGTPGGAVVFGNGLTGVTGTISTSNSLTNIGESAGYVTPLVNGNYVVVSSNWNSNRGAVTFCNGTTGTFGTISAANSLTGTADDSIGSSGITALSNGNYVVNSSSWNGQRGAVTLCDGTNRCAGGSLVTAANSLTGSNPLDRVGNAGSVALPNGNYVVRSYFWNDNRGAATFADGTTGITGSVGSANSLTGTSAGDSIGDLSITSLPNSNYLVVSRAWNQTRGAVTWGSGAAGISGEVTSANSLIGSTPDDQVGYTGNIENGVIVFADGSYAVRSNYWNNEAVPAMDAGAVSLSKRNEALVGMVTAENSVRGTAVFGGIRLAVAKESYAKQLVVGHPNNYVSIFRYSVTQTPFDYDGDGKADLSVFRPSAGSWFISHSSNNAFVSTQFGANGDLIAPADFDGDGKTDISVFRPTDGGWYRLNSSNNTFTALQFGASGDLPVPGDFDGDSKADLTVYRPSAGSWFRINSSNQQFIAAQFGVAEDKPLVGDFDGDGKADLVVFRPSSGTWYLLRTTAGFTGFQFGASGDVPTPNAFVR